MLLLQGAWPMSASGHQNPVEGGAPSCALPGSLSHKDDGLRIPSRLGTSSASPGCPRAA